MLKTPPPGTAPLRGAQSCHREMEAAFATRGRALEIAEAWAGGARHAAFAELCREASPLRAAALALNVHETLAQQDREDAAEQAEAFAAAVWRAGSRET